jgi:hypothetical protein
MAAEALPMTAEFPAAALDRTLDRANNDVVLIVDDVPDNLAVLHDALDESGYTVLVATHGEAALQRAAQARPDIVLLDAMMPGMDGFEVARRLKAARHRPHPDHLHDRPDRHRIPGGRAGGRRGGLRHQADQAQGGIGPYECPSARCAAGAPGGPPGWRGAQCAGCVWLCQHHRARQRRQADVADRAGARDAGSTMRPSSRRWACVSSSLRARPRSCTG